MKRTFKMLGMACLLGAFAFVGSSCKKNTETNSIKVSLPTVEETNIDGDRAYIDFNDGNKMKWSKDDQIMFYNLNSDYTKSVRNPYVVFNGVGTIDGDFEGESMGAAQDLGYYAFYPAEKVENYPIGPRNSQKFDVPAEQHYSFGTMDETSLVMAMKGHSPFEHFSMRHIFGFIKLRLKGTQKVEWISVTDNAFNLSGAITIDLPAVNENTLQTLINQCANYQVNWETYAAALDTYLHGEGGLNYSSETTGQTMTLYCDDPVQLNASNYTDFYITLRPGSLCKGFVVTVKYQGVEEPVVYNKFNPGTTEWAYGAYPQYPRGFAIRPGNAMGAKVN